MPIRRHGKGWEVRIQHGGRRYSKTVGTRSDAVYLEARLRQRVSDSRAGRVPSYTFEEALARWIREELPRLKSQKTYRSLIRAILPFSAGKSLSMVVDMADAIREEGMRKGLGPAPINRRLALVKRIAKLAYKKWGWLENDLGAKISLLPGENFRSQWVTPVEAKKLLAASKGPIREAIRWAVLTGLRRGEILAIRPENFRSGAVYLPDSKSGKPRSVPLPPELDPKKFPYGIHPTALSKGFQAARSRAKLPDIRFHDLRRTYATWLLQGGAGLSEVRDLLGHSNISMTSRYMGSSIEHLRKTVLTLPRLAAGTKRGRKASF